MRSRPIIVLPLLAVALTWGCAPRVSVDASLSVEPPQRPVSFRHGPPIVGSYLERYFEMYPTRATAAGWRRHDRELEDLSPERITAWRTFNVESIEQIERDLSTGKLSLDDEMDLELLLRRARREVYDLDALDRPRRDPLYWSGIAASANVMLLVRQDRPLAERLGAAVARARAIPRLAAQAQRALIADVDPEIAAMAARQARSAAKFYRDSFPRAAASNDPTDSATGDDLDRELAAAGTAAARALDELAAFLTELGSRATGSGRLGSRYGERFRLVTGIDDPVATVLARAGAALADKRRETAAYGRSVWLQVLPQTPMPDDDRALIRALFDRVAQDRAATVEEFIQDYRDLVAASVEFVRGKDIMTLPEPLTLAIDRSPSFFLGQSVGGVYAAGPFAAAEAKTLLFLPTPREDSTPEQLDAFFRDFNHHFNTMITPHEVIPGHYLQLKLAARHPRKVRALFGDGVYIEGWGTFCERLMLDLGWGGPLDRLAHLKKQLENIARAIVDIRVHTESMSRDEVLRLVQDEALQDEQFAANMWRRAITSSPQLTFYYLGYLKVHGLYDDVRRARGDSFDLKRFLDGMMEMGPVPVERYRERMLPDSVGISSHQSDF